MNEPWSDFTADPRTPDGGRLRASDADRNVALGVISEAYADGRLDRDEYDDRAAAISAAKLLRDLTSPMADLVRMSEPSTHALATTGTSGVLGVVSPDIHAEAVARYESTRTAALLGFIVPSMICWVIWAAVMFGEFAWPAIVTVATSAALIRTVVGRKTIIAANEREIVQEIEKQQHDPTDD